MFLKHKHTLHANNKVRALATVTASSPKKAKLYIGVGEVQEYDLLTMTMSGCSNSGKQYGCVYSLLAVHEQNLILAGRHSGSIDAIDTRTLSIAFQLQNGHHDVVRCMAMQNSEHSPLFSGSYDGTIAQWDLQNRTQINENSIPQYKCAINSIVVPHNNCLYTASALGITKHCHKSTKTWGTKDEILSLCGTANVVHNCDTTLLRLFSSSKDGSVRVYDCTMVNEQDNDADIAMTMELVPKHSAAVTCSALNNKKKHDDDKMIATGSADKTVKIWNSSYPYLIAETVTTHQQPIRSIAWLLDSVVITGSQDGSIDIHKLLISQ